MHMKLCLLLRQIFTYFLFSSSSVAALSAAGAHPIFVEMEAFASLPKIEFRCARSYQGKFDPAVVWANAAIMSRFPLHTAVARSYLSAMLHEATCERTFSYSGRLLTKQRLQIDPNQVGASAECTAGEAIFEMSAAEIKKHYQSKRKRKADANE